jgi:hypothetical protein
MRRSPPLDRTRVVARSKPEAGVAMARTVRDAIDTRGDMAIADAASDTEIAHATSAHSTMLIETPCDRRDRDAKVASPAAHDPPRLVLHPGAVLVPPTESVAGGALCAT